VSSDDVELQALLAQHAEHRDRGGQDRRLRVPGERQLVLGALEAELRDREAERGVGLLVRALGGLVGVREVAPHADALRALAGKQECRLHRAR